MRILLVMFLIVLLFGCGEKKPHPDLPNKTIKDSVIVQKPEGFKSTHQKDKEELGNDSLKKNMESERVKYN